MIAWERLCPPCRTLEMMLSSIPNWKECITYVNADGLSQEHSQLINKLGLRKLPALITDEEVIKGDIQTLFKKIKEVCT